MAASLTTDHAWRLWGERDPYFAVITDPQYRATHLDDAAKAQFFASGRDHAQHVLATCTRHLDAKFAPRSALDFGCGVGRVLLGLAERVEQVVGVDVAPGMLAEARRVCDALGLTNVTLLPSDDSLSALTQRFDLVHSCIVLQHIDIVRGRQLFRRLVDLVAEGGCGALQVTYGKRYHPGSFGQPPPPPVPPLAPRRGWRSWIGSHAGEPRPDAVASEIHGDPAMQMNAYNLSELMFVLQSAGVLSLHLEFTDHGGELGVFLFFSKPAAAAAARAA